jgi:hypothetical protein
VTTNFRAARIIASQKLPSVTSGIKNFGKHTNTFPVEDFFMQRDLRSRRGSAHKDLRTIYENHGQHDSDDGRREVAPFNIG